MSKDELEIKKDEDYVMRPATPAEKERLDTAEEIPEFMVTLNFDEPTIDRLVKQAFLEFDALVDERKKSGLEEKWDELERLYDGEIEDNDRLLFNLHVWQTKVKVDAIVRSASKAFLRSGKVARISPRPEMADNKDGWAVCDKQTDFIDYAMDEEIKPEKDFVKIVRCAATKFVGIGRVEWSYRQATRKREESYQGKNELVAVAGGQAKLKNDGLQDFLNTYPEAEVKQKGFVRQLLEEKKINLVVNYRDTVNNNPRLRYVKLKDFYVRNGCDYWEGLRNEHCVVERESYTYYELQQKQDSEEFQNVDVMFDKDVNEQGDASESYKTASYAVLRMVIMFKINENDKEESKIVAWFGEVKKNFLGAIHFPYYALDIDYIPFYLELNDYGFYGDARSVANTLKDSNIAQDALLSLYLHGLYSRTILTPIVKEGSTVERIFLDRIFREGDPLPVDEMTQDVSKELAFVQWPNMDTGGIMTGLQFAQRMDANVTGISDAAASGSNDVSDPTAPASKTIALLKQSGINIEDYITTLVPSFNIFITYVFQLYYQMSQEGRKFKIRRKANQVVGQDPFQAITRDELIARTSVESTAAAFIFDEVNERVTAQVALGAIQSNSFTAQLPKAQYSALKLFLESLGPRWKTMANSEIPNPEEFDQMMMKVAVDAVKQIQAEVKQAEAVTGVRPQVSPEQVTERIKRNQAEAYNPAMKAAREKAEAAA